MEKRYYWLRLKNDFFKSKRIKKLRRLAGGDTYTIIYLKMQLLSLEHEGVIQYTGLENSFAEELALDLDETVENVQVTLQYLQSCGLIETSDNINFLLPYAVENTGSEGSSAKRWREWNARQKSLDSNAMLTDSKQIPNGEIEIEKEIEKESELETEKEKESEIKTGKTDSVESVCRTDDVRRVRDAWNALGLSQLTRITADTKRGQALKARIKQNGVDSVLEAIERVRNSKFLQGQNKSGWVITFDWLVKPNNFLKVLEGQYDDHSGQSQTSQQRGGATFMDMWRDEYGGGQ